MNVHKERQFTEIISQIHPKRLFFELREVTEFIIFDNPRIWAFGFLIFMGMLLAQWIVPKLICWIGLPKRAQAHFRMLKGKNKDGEDVKLQERRKDSTIIWEPVDEHIGVLISDKKDEEQQGELYHSTRTSAVHFVALTVKILIIVFGFYCVFFVAGVSFYSLAISWGVIGLVLTYAFGSIFGNLMGSFTIFGTGLCVEGMVVKIADIKGKVLHIGTMYTTLSCVDPTTKIPFTASIPNSYFNTYPCIRFPVEELGIEHSDFKPTSIASKSKILRLNKRI
jgi:small-conductance mechanosensitive channel